MKSYPIYSENNFRSGRYSVMQIARYFTLTILGVLFLSFNVNAQKKKKDNPSVITSTNLAQFQKDAK